MKFRSLENIRDDLRNNYPNLHAFTNQNGCIEVAGIFPVRGNEGEELDRYAVSIIIPSGFPQEIPQVYEVGGQIPRSPDYHMNSDGSACVIIPDSRWECFPLEASFVDFLDGPLYNFFLGQTYYKRTGKWPFGEWRHGRDGLYDYYKSLINTDDKDTIARFLHLLRKNNLKKHYDCPCGSGLIVKKCCVNLIKELRKKISPSVAAQAMQKLGFDTLPSTYKRARLKK